MSQIPSTYEQIGNALDGAERIFGLDWLQRNARKAYDACRSHPVPHWWSSAKDSYLKHGININRFNVPGGPQLYDCITNLETVCKLPGFSEAIEYRLKEVNEFASAIYEVDIAAEAMRNGASVKFIVPPKSNIRPSYRSPDISIEYNGQHLYIECKRRSPYLIAHSHDLAAVDNLRRQVLERLVAYNADCVTVIAGFGQYISKHTTGIVTFVDDRLQERKYGCWLHNESNCWVTMNLPEPGLNIQKLATELSLEFRYYPASGILGAAVALVMFDAHPPERIIAPFKSARGQIPDGSCGIIYIDHDTTRMPLPHVGAYLDMIEHQVKRRLTPNANTRVGAVVLTAGIHTHQIRLNDTDTMIQPFRPVRVVRNPHSPLPIDFRIPAQPIENVVTAEQA